MSFAALSDAVAAHMSMAAKLEKAGMPATTPEAAVEAAAAQKKAAAAADEAKDIETARAGRV